MGFKKLLSVLVVTVLCFSLSVPAFAVSDVKDVERSPIDIDVEIERALNGETDLEIDTTDLAQAVLEGEDGTVEDVEVYVTTRVLPMQMSVSGGTNYATTVVAALPATDKTDVSTGDKDYVTATVTLYWTDVLGTANKFRGVSGSWTVATNPSTGKKATLSNSKVALQGSGPTARDYGEWYYIYPTSNSFEIKDSEYADGWWAYEAKSTVKINSSNTLTVKVSSGQIVIG